MQEILLTGVGVIAYVVLLILGVALAFAGTTGACLLGVLNFVVYIGLFVLWLICLINAFQGKYFKLPVIGDLAERWSAPSGAPRV